MTFLVVSAGHSGTMFLASQLAKAPGWTVLHEPDCAVSARIAGLRFLRIGNYGEVNSFLLTAARWIETDRRAVLLRNPYDVARSVCSTGHSGHDSVMYVRECLSTLDGLARDGWQVIRFCDIVSSPAQLTLAARRLGIVTLSEFDVDMVPLNRHAGETAMPHLDEITVREFDDFVRIYELEGSRRTRDEQVV